MVVVSVGAFIRLKGSSEVVVVGCNFGGSLSFFEGIVTNFMGITNPAPFGIIDLI